MTEDVWVVSLFYNRVTKRSRRGVEAENKRYSAFCGPIVTYDSPQSAWQFVVDRETTKILNQRKDLARAQVALRRATRMAELVRADWEKGKT